MTLKELISSNLEDFHLLHVDEEHDLATIVELYPDTLTLQGRADWADVLNANVERIYNGYYGIQADISGCEAERLRDFSYMLSGNVSATNYKRWVNDGEEPEKEVVETTQDKAPSAQALNGKIACFDVVISTEYPYLIGEVNAVDKLGSEDHHSGNLTDDVFVDFQSDEYSQSRIEIIEEHFSKVYGEPKRFEDLTGELFNMRTSPEKLLCISEHEAKALLESQEEAEAHCNTFTKGKPENEAVQKPVSEVKKGDNILVDCEPVIATSDAYMVKTANGREWNFESGDEYYYASDFENACVYILTEKDKMLSDLTDRLYKNLSDYHNSLDGFGKNELIDMASKINAMSDVYNYMTEWHEFDEHELEYFLQFQNPLKVVADEWTSRNTDLSDISFTVEHLYGHSDDILEAYPLMCDAADPVQEQPEKDAEKPKKSLEEKMKAAQKKADNHNAQKSENKNPLNKKSNNVPEGVKAIWQLSKRRCGNETPTVRER